LDALQTTILVSILATAIATVVGTAAAIGFSSMRRRPRNLCLTVNNIPMTNADIITGVSIMLLFLFACLALVGLSGLLIEQAWSVYAKLCFVFCFCLCFVLLLFAHVTFYIPCVMVSVLVKLHQLDPYLAEAALDLGATRWFAFLKVVL